MNVYSAMLRCFRLCLVLLPALCVQLPVLAQQLSAIFGINPRPSPYLSDWTQRAETQLLISISNTGAQNRSIYFTGKVTGNNGVYTQTKAGYKPPNPLQLPPNSNQNFTGPQLKGMFVWDDLESIGVDLNAVTRSGMLPEGSYELCVTIRDYQTGQALTAAEPSGCTPSFSIVFPQPPQLVAPVCGSNVATTQGQPILFSWMPSAGTPPNVQYRLRIVEIVGQRSANDALQSATTPAVLEKTVSGFSYLLNPVQLVIPKSSGSVRFAWSVKAFDPSQKIMFSNNGETEACDFLYGDKDVPPFFADQPGTDPGTEKDSVPCRDLEEKLKKLTDDLEKLKTEAGNIDIKIGLQQLLLDDCNKALGQLLDNFHEAQKAQKAADRLISYVPKGKEIPQPLKDKKAAADKDVADAKKAWQDQKKRCDQIAAEIKALEAKKAAIKSGEDEKDKLRDEIEKCKKEEADKKKKAGEAAAGAGSGTSTGPGSSGGKEPEREKTGAAREGTDCPPGSRAFTETVKEIDPCYVDEIELTPCNVTRSNHAIVEYMKKLIKKLKPFKTATEMAEQIAKAGSLSKAVCVNIHIVHDWRIVEYKWECINGKWVMMNKAVKSKGTDEHGWFSIQEKNSGVCCWVLASDDIKAMQVDLKESIQNKLDECR